MNLTLIIPLISIVVACIITYYIIRCQCTEVKEELVLELMNHDSYDGAKLLDIYGFGSRIVVVKITKTIFGKTKNTELKLKTWYLNY